MIAQGSSTRLQSVLTKSVSPAAAPTSERQIWQAAIFLVREHGADAAEVADREALKHRAETDRLQSFVWAWIARVTADLIRAEPDTGEYRH